VPGKVRCGNSAKEIWKEERLRIGTARPALDAAPEQVSRLVLKLLAKAAEDRYQSVAGITRDIERCQREWTTNGTISVFDLASHDVPEHLLIPQKLYGRDREVGELLKAFDETCQGRTAMLLVAGCSSVSICLEQEKGVSASDDARAAYQACKPNPP